MGLFFESLPQASVIDSRTRKKDRKKNRKTNKQGSRRVEDSTS